MGIDTVSVGKLEASAHDKSRVSGSTHNFYNYPARFSPRFVRTCIELFTNPGDLILDPFVGGGTTLVEATLMGRRAIGIDISELASFICEVKTTPLTKSQLSMVDDWAAEINSMLKLNRSLDSISEPVQVSYLRNINGRATWRIRKALTLALHEVSILADHRVRDFLRCGLLKLGQWSLDCKRKVPTIQAFRDKFEVILSEMIVSAHDFREEIQMNDLSSRVVGEGYPKCINGSAIDVLSNRKLFKGRSPKLVITSPPYPGVHILYHRWQVKGRRETPAPFWITDTNDGRGVSYYTLGDRHQPDLADYYSNVTKIFKQVRTNISPDTIIVQLIAFSKKTWQLPKYLEMMSQTGFKEVKLQNTSDNDDRIWRKVPSRKFYTSLRPSGDASDEVILVHRPR